jgi:hypothetical protein
LLASSLHTSLDQVPMSTLHLWIHIPDNLRLRWQNRIFPVFRLY